MEIFLVEDSPAVLRRMHDMLSALPGAHVCGTAARADTAIRDILAERPDLVVLDLKLEQGSGFDVLKALHREAPDIEVYMLSNFATEPYRRMARELGARGFFDKTNEFDRVREVVALRAGAQPSAARH